MKLYAKISVLWLFIFCLTLAGCSKDAEINAFLKEWNEITEKMSASLENGNVDAARTVFDARKDSLKIKWDGLKNTINSGGVDAQNKKRLKDSEDANLKMLRNAILKGSLKTADDEAAVEKMRQLMKDYAAIFTM